MAKHGMAEGLRVWYGADFNQVNQALASEATDPQSLALRGLALRQVLSLMIAQRRPSYYLTKGRDDLADLTDSHIRLLAQNAVLDPALTTAALASKVTYRDWVQQPTIQPIETNKGISVARSRLASMLNRPLYDLDRLDLSATSTLQGDLQTQASDYLKRLADPAFAAEIGLLGERLLTPTSTAQVRYSFTLLELTPTAHEYGCKPTAPTSRSTSTKAANWSWVPPPSCGFSPPTCKSSRSCTTVTPPRPRPN